MSELTREEWLARRRSGIGGSDVAAVLGLSPWKSPRQVWLDKTTDISDDRQTMPMLLDDPRARGAAAVLGADRRAGPAVASALAA